MKFLRFFIDRPITTAMVYSVLALMGIISFFRMPVDLLPGGDAGVLTIFVGIRGGLPPEDVESLVIKPIEDEMASLPNLDDIISVARKERAVITLKFKVGTDSSRAALIVQEHMAKIRGRLPKEIEKPVISRYDENQAPIMILALSSKKYTPEQMRDIADNELKPILKRQDGVGNIEIGGGRERKILIEFDQGRLEAYALPIRQVISQIGSENLNVLSGKVSGDRDSYLVRTVGAFRTLEEIGELPIAVTKEGSRIRLRDVAEIRDFYLEPETYSRLNRQPVVSAYIQKESLANTIVTAGRIRKASEEFKKTLDKDITFEIVSDQSIAIKKALSDVRKALLEGAFLSGIILLIFLRDLLTASFIFVSIPLSFIITLSVMSLCGLSMNVMTISGLAIATGMILDDSIVVLENLAHVRKKQKEEAGAGGGAVSGAEADDKKELAARATHEMLLALVACTVTKIIVFLPIIFLNPQVRMLYSGLAITVTSSLVISFIVSVSLIPCLAGNASDRWEKESQFLSTYLWLFVGSRQKKALRWTAAQHEKITGWIAPRMPEAVVGQLSRLAGGVSSAFFRIVLRDAHGGEELIGGRRKFKSISAERWPSMYRGAVIFLIRKRYWMAGGLLIALIATGWLYKKLDKEFVGSTEENEFTIFVELPSGAKLDVSDKVVTAVEKTINELPEIQQSVKTAVSRVEGWSSKVYVTLVPGNERQRTAQEIINFLRPMVSKIGQEYSAFIYFSEPTSSKEFLIDVYGFDYVKLRDIAVKIAQNLEKVPGLADIKLRYKPGRPEVRVEVDRQKASLFDFTIQDIAENLHAQIRGLRATYFLTPKAQIETVARLQESYRRTVEDVQTLSIINNKGVIVPVQQFANFEYGLTPSEIWRKGRERMIQVSANRKDIALNRVADYALKSLAAIEIPTGYYYEIGGDFPKLIETEKESTFAFVIMVLLVFTVLASLFESVLQPIVILIAVPLTLIGAVPLLYVTNTPVTLGTMIGFIMLGGISVGNSIMLVDVYVHLRKTQNKYKALISAGLLRVRPIMMTTLTTVLGLVPMVFEDSGSGSLWAPMALTVIGGLVVSTILVLFVLPAFALMIEDLKRVVKNLLMRLLSGGSPQDKKPRKFNPILD